LHLATDADIDKALTFVKRFESKTPPVTVRGNVERGKTLYQTCAACHGAAGEGNEQAHAPALAQRSDWYLARQLKSYREGWRGTQAEDDLGMQMRAMALTLPDDAAIQDVIAYIDTLSKP
jgi:cytochrome c553